MITEKIFKLGGSKKCQDALAIADVGEVLGVVDDFDNPGGYMMVDSLGDPVGYLSPTHWVSMEVWKGRFVLHAEVNSMSQDLDDYYSMRVRVITGDKEDEYNPPAKTERRYSVNVVGESFRQEAIGRTKEGEAVVLAHDSENKFDPRAIAVYNTRAEQIGFLPRDGWLTAALLDERQKFKARVQTIHRVSAEQRHAAVILEVILE